MPWLEAEHAASLPCDGSLDSFAVATDQPAREVVFPLIHLPWENGAEVVFPIRGWQSAETAQNALVASSTHSCSGCAER